MGTKKLDSRVNKKIWPVSDPILGTDTRTHTGLSAETSKDLLDSTP